MTFPNDAQRDWFFTNLERPDHDPTDAELGGLAAAWAATRHDKQARTNTESETP